MFARWQDRRERGEVATPESLCADCPELASVLAHRMQRMAEVAALLEAGAAADTTPEAPTRNGSTPVPAGNPPGFPFLSPAQAPDELGRLGGYRILSVLGEGGMGIAFVAEEPQPRRRVALKVMQPRYAIDETA